MIASSQKSATKESLDWKEIEIIGPPIGIGGFAQVFKGMFRGQQVAVKKWMEFPEDEKPNLRRLFIREVECARILDHPNVVRMLGACGKPLAIVMEFVEGLDLFRMIHSRSVYTWGHIQDLSIQMAMGMAHVHSHDIIHRDIKSTNFLVQPTGEVKVCDFGLGRIVDASRPTMTQGRGTAGWIALEVLESNCYDKSADVYSFGVTLWEMVTRRFPYEDKTQDAEVVAAVRLGERLRIPSGIPPELTRIIHMCWDVPRNRPTFNELVGLLSSQTLIPPDIDEVPVQHPYNCMHCIRTKER